ncbi:hypothetical protein ROZALSC1DRAFT_28547 [Rozella allomycis CSF55]|uniref:Ubiquitin-conjugating enzyme/RWD-like domain-containing protein n=1 Tax=Rozella allomycis (strain CSF55) TaxID=988480 RepID=A0A075B0K4_ROZAC|nr:Ubiquitin-conjugating enzyme/RWD-like domain-containing protein [Rozella allomycis CSF55]RKP19896.1 hypothetical protein ROZALSC1DRAFT_28547 [Rozella allomycis CSF55]|eukprot:EPZ36056.1 Ubiquitin-conjugating enzyme/RWD-like domain-containing protein [Rozella allomycis CSF55]
MDPNDPRKLQGLVVNTRSVLHVQNCFDDSKKEYVVGDDMVDIEKEFLVQEGSWVKYNDWIGIVIEVKTDFYIAFSNGAVCIPKDSTKCRPANEIDEDSYWYERHLPGQVMISKRSNFEKGKWIKGSFKSASHHWKGVLMKTAHKSVSVIWKTVNPILPNDSEILSSPKTLYGNELNNLEVFDTFLLSKINIGSVVKLKKEALENFKDLPIACSDENFMNYWMVVDQKTTVDVHWQDGKIENEISSEKIIPILEAGETDLSATEFVKKNESDKLGILQSFDPNERTCTVGWISSNSGMVEGELEELSIYDVKADPQVSFYIMNIVLKIDSIQDPNSWAGEIRNILPNGLIEVRWTTGVTENIPFKHLHFVYDSSQVDDEDLEDICYPHVDDDWMTIASDENSEIDQQEEKISFVDLDLTKKFNILSINGDNKDSFSIDENAPLDHLFLHKTIQFASNAANVAIRKDFKLLKELPENIYVTTFEDRIDLFRSIIIGSKGTVYEYAMFLFDIQLSSKHPFEPPSAYYHCWTDGLGKLNPNLYENGNICLSLLGTWEGFEKETWSSNSSIYQLLLSLQALVLVREPYYNEAGYTKYQGTDEGQVASIRYLENAFLGSVKSILHILNHPPSNYEALVKFYYIDCGNLEKVIQRCEALVHSSQEHEENICSWYDSTNQDQFPLKRISKGGAKLLTPIIETLKSFI